MGEKVHKRKIIVGKRDKKDNLKEFGIDWRIELKNDFNKKGWENVEWILLGLRTSVGHY
jgi:hypothetical protein